MYQGTRLAAAEAINSGITFVHDWCHNVRNPRIAREDLRALKESGLRARFSYGTMAGQDPKQPLDLADIEKLKNEWAQHSNEGLITLGMAWRGHGGNQPANAVPESVWRAEYERGAAARTADLGAFERLEGRARPDRRAEQGRHDQERAGDPRRLCDR